MNTGTDYALFYYDGASGQLVNLGDVQVTDIVAEHHLIKNQPYNQPPSFGYVPDGYKIAFTITRTGADLENFFAVAEANFNAGAVQKPGYLQQSVTNPDGSISRFQYQKMAIFLTDHGTISRDKPVTLKLEGYASTKVPIN
jgi:hypothetical protein